jgi:hypothetical protein
MQHSSFTKRLSFLSTLARLGLVLALGLALVLVAQADGSPDSVSRTYAPHGSMTRADGTPDHRPSLSIGQDHADLGQAPPAGLSAKDRAAIQERIRQAEYHLTWHEPSMAYTAPNRAHDWRVAYGATGVQVTPRTSLESAERWSWGLALARYGYADNIQPVEAHAPPRMIAESNHIEYHYELANQRISEWHINDERGLEQGFILTAAPEPQIPNVKSELVLELALFGNLIPKLSDDSQTIDFITSSGPPFTVLRYNDLHAYDATGRQLPAHLEILDFGSRISDRFHNPQFKISIVVDDTDALYPLAIDPLVTSQVAKLTASDGAAGDRFGRSVAISGDTVVVGSYLDDDKESESGSAYVFERNQGEADNWGEVKKLTASDGVAGDYFGYSVAISGDTVVVGSYGNDDKGANSGSVYVFERNQGGAGNWGEVKKLTTSDGVVGDYFGYSVTISGDTVVVGSYLDDDKGSESGSAYLFERNQGGAGNWGEVKKLTASDGTGYDYFSSSVAISGDTVVVGAFNHKVGANAGQGAAYVFERNQGGADNWGEMAKLTASDGTPHDEFGFSVAISGDTIVVGAYGNDDKGATSGSAYVFECNQGGAGNWGEAKKLTASDGAVLDWFGFSVAISGDALVVGAHYVDDKGRDSGSAYVFERNQGGADNWGEVSKLTASDGAAGDYFGYFVAISRGTAIIGAYRDNDKGYEAGSAYVYRLTFELYLPIILKNR